MNRRYRNRRMLTSLFALAVVPMALGSAYAAAVESRSGAVVSEYGRASGQPYWMERSAQPVPAPIKNAYAETRSWLGKQSTEAAKEQGSSEPMRYGRSGGFIGLQKFEAWDWSMAHGASNVKATPQQQEEGRTSG